MKIVTILVMVSVVVFFVSPTFAIQNAANELRDKMLGLPIPNCYGQGETCGVLHHCCDPYFCDRYFYGTCKLCAWSKEACGKIPCCPPYVCIPLGPGTGVCH
ncbi:hypothetical protein ACHQM5_030192 [Ranunculus cassubicifolius]